MITQKEIPVTSLLLYLHDGKSRMIGYYPFPVSLAAPMANRILRERLSGERLYEPWYELIPIYEKPIERSPLPPGHTSLFGTRYDPQSEPPPRVTLKPDTPLAGFTLLLTDFGRTLFSGDYTLDDIFLHEAEYQMGNLIKKGVVEMSSGPFYYSVEISPVLVVYAPESMIPQEALDAPGVFRLPRLAPDRRKISFRKLPADPLPEKSPVPNEVVKTLGKGGSESGAVQIHQEAFDALSENLILSRQVETGGYLLGVPFRKSGGSLDEDASDFQWVLEIHRVVPASGTWGGPGTLLFTGESWSRITRSIHRDFPGQKLVGWFHTHLFDAGDGFGLSGLDQDLHRRFFPRPWQVAFLVNISSMGHRTLRCYQQGPEQYLKECVFTVVKNFPWAKVSP